MGVRERIRKNKVAATGVSSAEAAEQAANDDKELALALGGAWSPTASTEKTRLCSECKKDCRADRVWLFRLVSLGETDARLICWQCVNQVKERIIATKGHGAQVRVCLCCRACLFPHLTQSRTPTG